MRRAPWNKGRASSRPLSSGEVVDDDFRARFRQLRLDGVPMGQIAKELGASRNTLTRLKQKMNLPNRERASASDEPAPVEVKTYLSPTEFEALVEKCRLVGRRPSSYLAELVRERLGV